jgi:hypothetical protein
MKPCVALGSNAAAIPYAGTTASARLRRQDQVVSQFEFRLPAASECCADRDSCRSSDMKTLFESST